jgi:hypothetical protein
MKTLLRSRANYVFPFVWIAIIALFWLYGLEQYPVLHGDEAWFGNVAYLSSISADYDWHGMNLYTGAIQQNLVAAFFNLFGVGMFQLRIVGVIFNVIAVGIFIYSLLSVGYGRRYALFFLLFISQSVLWLVYPRIAWEVNSFNLFFMALIFWALINMYSQSLRTVPMFVFFSATLFGSYNHIIFACIPVALLVSSVLHDIQNQVFRPDRLLLLTANVFNVIVLFALMNFDKGFFGNNYLIQSCLLLLLLMIVEVIILRKIGSKGIELLRLDPRIPVYLVNLAIAGLLTIFIWKHGIAFYDTAASFKTFTHIYSFEPHDHVITIYHIFTIGLLSFLAIQLYRELRTSDNYFALFIISYAGLLTLLTRGNSPRYYMCLLVIIFLYLTVKLGKNIRGKLFAASLVLMSLLSWSQLLTIYSQDQIACAQHYVTFGKQVEPLEHFRPLPSENQISVTSGVVKDDRFDRERLRFWNFIKSHERGDSKKSSVKQSAARL